MLRPFSTEFSSGAVMVWSSAESSSEYTCDGEDCKILAASESEFEQMLLFVIFEFAPLVLFEDAS